MKDNKTIQTNGANNPYVYEWINLPLDSLKVVAKNKFEFTNGLGASYYVQSGQKIRITKNNSELWHYGIVYGATSGSSSFRIWGATVLPTDTIQEISVAKYSTVTGGPHFFTFKTREKFSSKVPKTKQDNKLMIFGNRVEVSLNMELVTDHKTVGACLPLPVGDGGYVMDYMDFVFTGMAINVTDKVEYTLYITLYDVLSGGDGHVWLYLNHHPKSQMPNWVEWLPQKTYKIFGNFYYYLA